MALIYINPEAALTWLSAAGTEALTMGSLGAGAGHQGAQHDFTAAARPQTHAWRAWVKFAGTPVVGETVSVYWKTSDGTSPDNDDGTGDIAVSNIDKLKNLQFLGAIAVDQNVNTVLFVKSGTLDVDQQYGQPVFWNNSSANALSSTDADHGFNLTPIPPESQ